MASRLSARCYIKACVVLTLSSEKAIEPMQWKRDQADQGKAPSLAL
jgi:hypothetical protein